MNQMYLEPTIKKQIGKSHVNLNYNILIFATTLISGDQVPGARCYDTICLTNVTSHLKLRTNIYL